MKQADIKHCAFCDQGVMHDRLMTFFIVSAAYWVVDLGAVSRQHGLEQHMGAAAPLAQIMGPNEDIAKKWWSVNDLWVCLECASMRRISDLLQLTKVENHDLAD